jgi:hypothetical protein
MANPRRESLTIANSAAVSGAFSFNRQRVVGVVTPGTWSAADITFEIEEPADTFVKVVNRAGVIYKVSGIATGASEYHMISGDANQGDVIITGSGMGRVVSTNTGSEADTDQGGARTVVIYLADV